MTPKPIGPVVVNYPQIARMFGDGSREAVSTGLASPAPVLTRRDHRPATLYHESAQLLVVHRQPRSAGYPRRSCRAASENPHLFGWLDLLIWSGASLDAVQCEAAGDLKDEHDVADVRKILAPRAGKVGK